jgi:hypothetical protein
MHTFCRFAALTIIWTAAVMSIPAAAQGTPEQRAACEGDAQRLCAQYIPDIDRITACMQQNRARLSRPCRAVFDAGRKPRT